MKTRTIVAAVTLAAGVMIGALGTQDSAAAAPSCKGQHVAMMVREHRGMAAATAHHNTEHGTTLTVGQHLRYIAEMCDD